MSLVKLFNETDTVFTSDGNQTIRAKKALVHEEINGDYYLELEVFNTDITKLANMGIVAVNYRGSWQGFRLGYAETYNSYTYYKCWHVSYDMKDYLITELDLDNTAYNTALASISSNTTNDHPFTFTTSISATVDMDLLYCSLFDAVFALTDILDAETYIIRDNYHITLSYSIGQDNGLTVETGKNMTVLDKYESIDKLVNELYPTTTFNNTIYGISGNYIYDYSIMDRKYTKHVEFDLLRPEYYSGLYGYYTDLINQRDKWQSQKTSDENAKASAQSKYSDSVTRLATMRQEVAAFEQSFREQLAQSIETVENIFQECTTALTTLVNNFNEDISKKNEVIESYNNDIWTYQQQYNVEKDVYDDCNAKTKNTKKYSAKAIDGFKKKAKEAKEYMDFYKKKISEVQASIDKLESDIRSITSKRDKANQYLSEVSSAHAGDTFSSYDISKIVKCLQENGMKVVGDIAAQYAQADDTIDDKDATVRDIDNKYSKIYTMQQQVDSLSAQISALDASITNDTTQISTFDAQATTQLAQLESVISSDLLQQATIYFAKYKYPQVMYEVESLPIDASIGDTVQILHSLLNVDLTSRVECIEYDCIADKVSSLQFGNANNTLKDLQQTAISMQTEAIARSQVLLQNAYSNLLTRQSEIEGYVIGMQSINDIDGEAVIRDSRIDVADGSVRARVTETKANEIADRKIEVALDGIVAEVTNSVRHDVVSSLESYTLELDASNGMTVDNQFISNTITATVRNLGEDITSDIDDRLISWSRKSTDAQSDLLWNSVGKYGKTLTITQDDVQDNSTFSCDVHFVDEENLVDTNGNNVVDTNGNPIIALVPQKIIRADIPILWSVKESKALLQMLAGKMLLLADTNGHVAKIDIDTNEYTSNIKINADNINANGLVTANNNFVIRQDGTVQINGGSDLNLVGASYDTPVITVTATDHKTLIEPRGIWIYDGRNTVQASFARDGFNCSGDGQLRNLYASGIISASAGFRGDLSDGRNSLCFRTATNSTTESVYYPGTTNSVYLGNSNARFKGIFLNTSPSVSSDRRVKKDFSELDSRHTVFFMSLLPTAYKYIDNDSNRLHIGFIAQDVEQAMYESGLDSLDFAGFIKSPIYAKDEHGNDTEEIVDYVYSLRYEEFIALITKVLQDTVKRQDSLELRIQALERKDKNNGNNSEL